MAKQTQLSLAALRLGLGWLLFYAGITKLINPDWSAAGYLSNAGTFPEFFSWLALPQNLVWVNLLNEWGLTLIGIVLLIGIEIRLASLLGGALMFLYWLPVLNFPFVGEHGFVIDEHIIYILAFAVLFAAHAKDTRTIKNLLKPRV